MSTSLQYEPNKQNEANRESEFYRASKPNSPWFSQKAVNNGEFRPVAMARPSHNVNHALTATKLQANTTVELRTPSVIQQLVKTWVRSLKSLLAPSIIIFLVFLFSLKCCCPKQQNNDNSRNWVKGGGGVFCHPLTP